MKYDIYYRDTKSNYPEHQITPDLIDRFLKSDELILCVKGATIKKFGYEIWAEEAEVLKK